MSPMMTIAKREFRSYFDSPVAYVVVCLSALGLGLMFFKYRGGFWQADRASLQAMFEYIPFGMCMLIVPVITMQLMAEERRSGTLEMLITLPVRDSDVILGKYLGALGLLAVILATSLAYPIMMFKSPWNLGPLDWGPVQTGYLGMLLFAAATTAIGLLVSSLTSSQAISFFVTVFLLLGLWFLGSAAELVGGPLGTVLQFVSLQTRLTNFVRGLIDTRDVIYFISVTVLTLVAAFRSLERRKWA